MKKKLLGLLLAAAAVPLFAQHAQLLTLKDAVDYALQNKADAEKARLDIRKGDAQIKKARANALPKIDINSSTSYNPLLQQSVLPGEIFGMPGQMVKVSFGQKWTASNMIQLQQAIFNQQVFTGLKAAKSTKEFYILNAQLTNEQIIERVANSYYQVYQAEQLLKNAQNNLSITDQTIKIIKGLYDAGLAKKIDYDRTVVARNNVQAGIKQYENSVMVAENALKFMIGMDVNQEIELPDETFDPKVIATNDGSYTERTELKVLNKQLELLNWQKKATIATYYPTVGLGANFGYYGQGPKFPYLGGQSKGIFWSDLAGITLNINIPIFHGFATKAQEELDQVDILKAQADLRDTTLGLDLAYKNAVTRMDNNMTMIKMQEGNVKLAENVLSNTRSNYQYGLATLNDILDAERDLTDAKNNLTNAKLDYKLAEIELLKSEGKLNNLN